MIFKTNQIRNISTAIDKEPLANIDFFPDSEAAVITETQMAKDKPLIFGNQFPGRQPHPAAQKVSQLSGNKIEKD